MRLKVVAAFLAGAALLAFAGPASARAPIPTTIVFGGAAPGRGDDGVFFGYLTSPNPRCISGRTVKAIMKYPGKPATVIDSSVSTRHGYWVTGGNFIEVGPPFPALYWRVTAKHLGPGKKRKTCAASSGHPPLG